MVNYRKIHYLIPWLFLTGMLWLISSCSVRKTAGEFTPDNTGYFSGILVIDARTHDTLVSYHPDYYFTPASTVKLFTLYAAGALLPDSIATVKYAATPDRLYITPQADPTFLHDSMPNKTYDFLAQTRKEIIIVPDSFPDFKYGYGWQWDDFEFYYMPEKSLFPLYGNLVRLYPDGKVIPGFFRNKVKSFHPLGFARDFDSNVFYINNIQSVQAVPYITSLETSAQLLADTLHKKVYLGELPAQLEMKAYRSTPLTPVYKRLMDESENFLAEQLMLITAKKTTGVYNVKRGISYVLDSLLTGLPRQPAWVDASGLSRYNLFTPSDMVYLLDTMLEKWGKSRIYALLPFNGPGGKLHDWYPSEFTFVHAKTGSLSNNHNLCGYLDTKSGKTLIFSYMNNNFKVPSRVVKNRINRFLKELYEKY